MLIWLAKNWIGFVRPTNLVVFTFEFVLARATQMRGAAIAISAMVDQFGVNPCISSQYDNLNSRREYLNKRSAEYVDWVTQNVPRGVTDCFTCKPQDTFHRSKTLV